MSLEGHDGRDAEHELWLAMQAAHKKYTNACASLAALTSQVLVAIPCSDQRFQIEKAASEQRAAFENYIEARMQFSEFRYDRNSSTPGSILSANTPGASLPANEDDSDSWVGFIKSRLAFPAAAVALLCTAAFTQAYLIGEHKHVRDSDEAQKETPATTTQTRDNAQALVQKIDVPDVTRQSAARDPAHASGPPIRSQQTGANPAEIGQMAEGGRQQPSQVPFGARNPGKISANNQVGAPSHYQFRLMLSRHFTRVGPLRLSVRMVNTKKKYFDLCVMSDDFRLRHVNLYKPVRINLSSPSRRVDLVASRIDKNTVQGHFSVFKSPRSKLTVSQLRRSVAGDS